MQGGFDVGRGGESIESTRVLLAERRVSRRKRRVAETAVDLEGLVSWGEW